MDHSPKNMTSFIMLERTDICAGNTHQQRENTALQPALHLPQGRWNFLSGNVMLKISMLLFAFLLTPPFISPLAAQDDLDAFIDEAMDETSLPVVSTFHSTRVVNGQSVEMMPHHGLDFRISHRFGYLDEGWGELWGVDNPGSYFLLEYGFTDWLNLGIGRATYNKMVNSFVKIRVLRQTTGGRSFPFTVVYHSAFAVDATKYLDKERNDDFNARLNFTQQLLIASKITSRLSLQFSPTYIHRNQTDTPEMPNNIFAMGVSGRYNLGNRFALTAEWFWVDRPGRLDEKYYNPIAFGIDIQRGGHVFQIHLTNAFAMTEESFIPKTNGDFWDGGVRLGFNIAQVFAF